MSDTETQARDHGGPRGRVLVVMCNGAVAEHALPASGVVVIGRGSAADVVVDHPTLSRAHAELALGAHVTVRDRGSRNGTVVAGRKVLAGETVLLAPGSPIELGDALLVLRSGGRGHDLLASSDSSDAGRASSERTIARLAVSEVPVLLVGEPGTGKASLAARIHAASARAVAACVTLEATRGTVVADVEQAVAGAAGGTLVVREPSLLPLPVQVSLREALRAAAGRVRTVTSTSRDLFAASRAGELDVALLHRLAGVSLVVPPLRARVGELAALVDTMLADIAAEHGRPRLLVAPDAFAALAAHTWPGNLRELRNVLAAASILARGRVLAAVHLDLDGAVQAAGAGGGSLADAVDEAEHRRILEALRASKGNQTAAARALGISRGTLIARLQRFGVPRPRK